MAKLTDDTISCRTYMTSSEVEKAEDKMADMGLELWDTKDGTEQAKKTPYYVATDIPNGFEVWKKSVDIDEMLFRQYAIDAQKAERSRIKSSLGLVKGSDKVSKAAIKGDYDKLLTDGLITQEIYSDLVAKLG